ncbi:MAG: hypothetical protein A2Y77_04305 [Planctomycetes bacterium RBG_13_62_9]|nr:MAG: hypothetical protein A2Y77_04305 [Planctomycetes bacterium RBG_13_62_9]
MDAARGILKVLALCCLCNMASHAQPAGTASVPGTGKGPAPTIELAKLEIAVSSLELSYTIRNGSDHEAWICTEVSHIPFEMYVTHDQQALLIRRHLDVPCWHIWHHPPLPGTYMRLRPGAAQPESLRIDLPAKPTFLYAHETTEVIEQTVNRLVLEIGYYDENLPALVRSICEVADKFSDEGWKLYTSGPDPNMWHTYFRGLTVRGALSGFDVVNKDPDSTGYVRIDYSYQALAEKVLRMEINGVAIPYKGRIEREAPPRFPATSD